MRLLFAMAEPGYLRMYGSTIAELARRGHAITLAYDRPDKRSDVSLAPEGVESGVAVAGAVPWKPGEWTALSRFIRLTADYGRYLDTHFVDADWLRRRGEQFVPNRAQFLKTMPSLRREVLWPFIRGLTSLEHVIPNEEAVDAFIRQQAPDAVVVTPLVLRGEGGVRQTEIVKTARALGIPVAVAVASWDHLTSKGLMRIQPDLVYVWNDIQKQEAIRLHGVAERKIVVTGAQLFDHWFLKQPQMSREQFLQEVGLPTPQPVILYVGSSQAIAGSAEPGFVRRWLTALRQHADPTLRDAAVLVRPHPSNIRRWHDTDLSDLGEVAIWPRTRGSFPMNERDESMYFHSLYYSAAILGINTSAMVEAAIIGRPVHTVLAPEFSHSQDGTIHFHYLLAENGGCVRLAHDLPEHLDQLGQVLRDPDAMREQLNRFVRSFVRPQGLDRPCTPILADAIESLPSSVRTRPRQMSPLLLPVRHLVRLAAVRAVSTPKRPAKVQPVKLQPAKAKKAKKAKTPKAKTAPTTPTLP
jgi:hypothetical protein